MNRSAEGRIIADPLRFPAGLTPVIDHIHSLGLKFGLSLLPEHNTTIHCVQRVQHGTMEWLGSFWHDFQEVWAGGGGRSTC